MRQTLKPFYYYLLPQLLPSDFKGYILHAPKEDFYTVRTELLESYEPGNNDDQVIIIRSDKFGRLVPTGYGGRISDVVNRRVLVESPVLLDDKDIVIIILEPIVYSRFSLHRYDEDRSIMESQDTQYIGLPCLAVLARNLNKFTLIDEIKAAEGARFRSRIPGYFYVCSILEAMDVNLLEKDANPIYIEEEDDEVNVYGRPDEDELTIMGARDIKVYSPKGTTPERTFVNLVRHRAVDGAGLDPSSYGSLTNDYAFVAMALEEDLQRRGGLTTPFELRELELYSKLSSACSNLGRYIRNPINYRFHLDRCDDIFSYRLETPVELSADERLTFIEKTLSAMRIRDAIIAYDTVIMMAATAPSMPITDGAEFLRRMYESYVRHEMIRNAALLQGRRPFCKDKEDSRVIMYIYLCKTTYKYEEQ